ncbi:MAG: hypothetical protein U9O53_01290, partial [archaeon]|nr:hypothetical protein [archaeon]
MKMLTLFIIVALTFLLLPTATYADRDIINTFNTQNVFAEAYNCLDPECDTVGTFSGSFPDGKTTTSGQITIRYPTTLATHGYAIYFFSPGYIPKAYHDDFWGTEPPVTYSVEFHKKDVCSSTIESLTVTNDEHAEVPLVINTQANLNATFHSAFYENDNGVGYIPDAYKDDYYSFDTHVTLEIYKGTTPVHTYTKEYTKNPDDDGAPLFLGTSQDVEFTWTPTTDGSYTAIITTEVVDDVCLSSLTPYSDKNFSVLEALPRNECYAILNNLTNSNPYPIVGEEQTAQFGKISNHANDYIYSDPNYILTPVSTAITYTVKDSTDAIVTTDTVSIIANSQPLTPEYYTFTWTPTDSGMHSIILTGFSDADMCTSLENTADQISMNLNVDPIPTYSVNFQISADSSPLESVLVEMDSKSGTT